MKLDVPTNVLTNQTLTAPARLVYALIYGNPGEKLPITRMCAALHLRKETIASSTRELKRHGLLKITPPKRRPTDLHCTRPTSYRALVHGDKIASISAAERLTLTTAGRDVAKSRILLVALLDSAQPELSASDVARLLGLSVQQAQRARKTLKRLYALQDIKRRLGPK